MHTLGVLVELRAAGAASDELGLGHLHNEAFGNQTNAMAFGQ